MGMTKKALAEYLAARQPPSVRTRLMRDEAFWTRFELPSVTVLTIGGVASFDQRELFDAVRRVLAEGKGQKIVDIKGREILVSTEHGGIVIKSAQGGDPSFEAHLKALMILSPRQDERKRELKELLDYLGPTAPDYSSLQSAADQRELSDDEVGTLIGETINGVVPLQARASGAIEGKEASLNALVPSLFGYFERFCGPDPIETEPDAYLGINLPAYRKELIRRDLEQGLDICLFGALSGELTPGIWTEQLADDDLWNAMTACDPMRDPFSLLGALDIALGRQHDQRYRDFAEGAVIKLLDDKFSRPDGNDTYELLPLLAELVLNRINTLEGGALRAPYWKRMCAWMQAAFLSRLTLPFSLDVGELRMWARANMTQAGMYSVMLDLRREPMYRASEMSPSSLREEIASRLILLRSRHEAAGHHMPRSDEIDELIARIARQGSPLGCTLPGPLEGHRRPAETEGRRLPVEVAKDVLEIFAPSLSQWKWANLAYLSQYFEFDEELLLRACDAVRKCDFGAKGETRGADSGEVDQ